MDKTNNTKNQEQVIYARLFDVILEQKLPPGAKLTETPLSNVFGVSRTVIRRVLLRLSHEGVVEIKPNIGASVVSTTPEEVAQYFETRRILENAVVKKIAGQLNEFKIETLSSLVREENRFQEVGNRAKALRKSTEFHFYLADLTDNHALADIVKNVISRTSLIVSQYNLLGSGGCACSDHSSLINVLKDGTPDEAEKIMDEHLKHIEQGLFLGKQTSEPDLYAIFNE